ncbi:zonadhesin-like [Hyposmocoma kahamanoa]|uniref:zonadhesin-like n=1 Tax=Hyposmocoma kahamanoa TaxID=1477025 RepID=UPI000E6D65B2|nr:zonadhesin-like [Hyposmocoma kahamanoa]
MIKLILFGALVANIILITFATNTDCDDNNNKPTPKKCKGKNERYEPCPNQICQPKTCDELGFPLNCPAVSQVDGVCQDKPACICIDGYVRNKKGVCIPKDKCPSCGGDPNAKPGCGINCGRLCSNYQQQNVPCPEICKVNACDCKGGYVYDENTNKCVKPSDCTPSCGENEIYSECTNGGCIGARNCTEIGKPKLCILVTKGGCKKGCLCKEGFLRDCNGVCIPQDQCPSIKCNRPNEQYECCPKICPPQTCESLKQDSSCDCSAMTDVCKGQCMCKPGFYRNKFNDCISEENCRKCLGPNEYYACGGACDNVCATLDKQSQDNCPIVNIKCNDMCYCDKGYARDANGVCIPIKDCPPFPELTSNFMAMSRRYFMKYHTPLVTMIKLILLGILVANVILMSIASPTSTDCDDGNKPPPPEYCDDGNKPPPPERKCKKNERYEVCPIALCQPKTCAELGYPVGCPGAGPGGTCPGKPGCICIDGYLRNDKGICVPKKQCPSCGGDTNAESGCGQNCGRRCSNYKQSNVVCPLICELNGCDCKKDYVYDDNIRKCVHPKDCTPTCGANQRYSTCIQAECRPLDCKDKGKNLPCPRIRPESCKKGCVCVEGYLMNANGECVPVDQCKPACGDNEFYNTCPPRKCDAEYCPKTRDSPQACVSPKNCGKPRCTCNFNHKRDWETGKCIPIADCPPFECHGPNEEYQSCPPRCPGQNCTDYINKTTCPKYRIGIVVPCEPKCRCKEGYYRNSQNICIEACECEKDCNPDNNNPDNSNPGNNNPDNNNPGNNNPGNNNPGNNNPGNDNPGNNNPGNNVNNTEVQAKFNLGLADFASKFLNLLVKKNPGKSVFSSALSVDFPLGALTLYAEESSLDELLKLLNLANKDEVRSAFQTALSEIKSNNVTMDIANKVYLNKEYQFSDAFSKDSTEVFNAPAEEIDVSDSQKAADIMNQWVESKTNGRIKNLIPADAISTLTRLILINAIYFKGDWKYQFDEKNTQDQDFYVTPDKTVKVPTMYQKNKFFYTESQDLQAQMIELRYTDEEYKMVILLPFEKDGLQGTLDKLNANTLTTAMNSLVRTDVRVYLPKFKIETQMELIEILKACGVTKIFNVSDSGLKGILKQAEKLAVTGALQKAFLEVNEKGSEAAAATAIILTRQSASINQREIIFRANHPFLLFILKKDTTLFSGAFLN